MAGGWDPRQYERFADERRRPFLDLLGFVRPRPGMRVVDLGCGTGELTRLLHQRLDAARTLGVDRSEAMLAGGELSGDGFELRRAELTSVLAPAAYDLVLSNAALHWVEDHASLFARLTASLRPEGQLAVQVPANHDTAAWVAADELASEEPFRSELGGFVRRSPVLAPERYAELLDELGFAGQDVQLRVYPHRLASRSEVLAWISGTYLKAYEERLAPDSWRRYLGELEHRLAERLPDRSPFFFPFKRILMWARRPPRDTASRPGLQ